MDFIVAADTDIGNVRKTNQDSVAVLIADTNMGAISFGIICDGMGGLAKGELASATLIHVMVNWFKVDLPLALERNGISDGFIREQWTSLIKKTDDVIKRYGFENHLKLGTTISAILLTQSRYYVVNVGDSRIYELYNHQVNQITEDHTLVARELKYGIITPEEARVDPRNSILIQCVGASKDVYPDFFFGDTKKNAGYVLCSDGFRHLISNEEMYSFLSFENNKDKNTMQYHIRQLIEMNKQRMERDNITVALIKTY